MKDRPKIGELVKGWRCPCGCGLQLDRYQVSDEQRLIALLGPTPRYVNLRPVSTIAAARKDPPEPTTTGLCRNCARRMSIFTYLADSLKLRGAPWPLCDACMQHQERAA